MSSPGSQPLELDVLAATAAKARILLVDDDADLILVSERILERAGYHVTRANDGMEALSALGRAEFDLIVSDLDMPRLDGLGLLRSVQETQRQTPFIFITGNPTIETAIFAVNHGVVQYLTKPFAPTELADAAKRAIGTRRLEQLRHHMAQVVAEQGRIREEDKSRFESALEKMFLAYQPIVHWPTRSVFGHEALVRTKEPTIPHPGVLFEVSERLGETDRLSRAIRKKCASAVPLAPAGTMIFVNLHARDLRDPDLIDPASALAQHADRVVLEVAERASIENIKEAAACVAQLRTLGFRIAVDDIGSGYAGLNSFALLEPDVVKLDMALVRDVDKSNTKQRLIEAFTNLCKAMNIGVIAEGIETQSELDALCGAGCELFQGYLLARPDPKLRSTL